ncbi:NADPH-dependent FMN FAD containing oxidoreductase [Cryptosporidium xiaoi]|uniref:NADPH-dependent FMN FAD containing oxidoreductase n=1 Tax=Cryptosporidium xiaoi TaxID=659607 RepID=A0AAV9Y0I9_9CRYT
MNTSSINDIGIGTKCPKRVWLVYASQTGKSERLCYEIRNELWSIGVVGYPTSIEAFEDVFFGYFESKNEKPNVEFPLTIFVVSTTGQGDVPDNMISFWNRFLLNNMNTKLLKTFNFTIFGMGDRCFGNSRFNLTARKLRHSLLSFGAVEQVPWGLGDESHDFGILGEFDPWISNLKATLKENGSYIGDELIMAFKEKLPPYRYVCNILEDELLDEKEELRDVIIDQKKHIDYLKMNKINGITTRISRIICNNEAEKEFKSKCTKLIKMRVLNDSLDSGHRSGTYVSIWPTNSIENVAKFSKLMNNDINLNTVLSISENPKYYMCICNNECGNCRYKDAYGSDDINASADIKYTRCFVYNELCSIYSLPLNSRMTIFTLLYRYLDIMNIPDRRFLSLCFKNTNEELHKKKLFEMIQTSSDSKKEYFDYVVDEHRNYMEVLWDFNSVKLSIDETINTIPIILPRQYSVCNSPNWYNESIWKLIYFKYTFNKKGNTRIIPELLSNNISLFLKNRDKDYKIFNKIRNRAIQSFLENNVINLTNSKHNSNIIDLCVDVIEWNTALNRKIRGFCSDFLSNMKPHEGEDILISFSSRMNFQTINDITNPNIPILLLSCGLGITGIISIIQERVMNNLLIENNKMNCLICLGMRYSNVSYPFLDQLYDFSTNKELKGKIKINISYSRTNPSINDSIFSNENKCVNINSINSGCYIQTLLLNDHENHEFVVDCLLNGYIVVCGNALTMPIEIRETLSKILVSRGNFEKTEDSMLYIRKLIRYGRYIEETWK